MPRRPERPFANVARFTRLAVGAPIALAAFATFATFAASGCIPELPKRVDLYPISGAPPARRVEVVSHDDRHAITVTSGVAFGVHLWDQCTGKDLPPPKLTIADPTILGASVLSQDAGGRGWLLFGVKPGQTTLVLEAVCAKQTYAVTVLAP